MEVENDVDKIQENELKIEKLFEKLRNLKQNYKNLGDNMDIFLKQFSLSKNDKSNSLRECLISQLDIEMIDQLINSKTNLEEFLDQKCNQLEFRRCKFIESMISRRVHHHKKCIKEFELKLNYFKADQGRLKEEFTKIAGANKDVIQNIPALKSKNKNAEKSINEVKYRRACELDEKYSHILKKYDELSTLKTKVNETEKKIDSFKNFPIPIISAKELINSMKAKSKELDDQLYNIIKK